MWRTVAKQRVTTRGVRVLLCTAALLLVGQSQAAAQGVPVQLPPIAGARLVRTEQGLVQGAVSGDVLTFKGIPYAAPPIGDLRWKAPIAPPRRAGVYLALDFAAKCIQGSGSNVQGSEDCLYLNVFGPASAGPGTQLPVVMWIHGGAYANGTGNDWDGTSLAKNNGLIVVTINYRLGALGFFAHPGLSSENGGKSGNYGILDQQAAMAWTRANIANFGGDSSNLTIFGQSAGGNSVYTHLASPVAAGLFDKALILSGAYVRNQPSLASAEALGEASGAELGCPGTDSAAVACLRSLPVSDVTRARGTVNNIWSPVLDDYVLTEPSTDVFAAGQFNQVPVISGAAHDEGLPFARGFAMNPLTEANYATRAAEAFPGVTAEAMRGNYPTSTFSTPTRAYATAYGDYRFLCGMLADAQKIATYVPQSWTYQFAQQDPPAFTPDAAPDVWPGSFTPVIGPWSDFHSADNQYWFDLFRPADRTPVNVALSATMRAYFANFAQTGDPNGPGLPAWTPVPASPRTVLNFATPVQPNFDAFTEHKCGYWETVPPSDRLL